MICLRDEGRHVHCNIWPQPEDDDFSGGRQSNKYICCYSTPLSQGNASAVSQIYVSDESHNLSAKQTRPIVAYRSERKSLQRWQERGPKSLCCSVWGFSSSQRVGKGGDKWLDWDLCNFITPCLTRQWAGHRYVPRRHSIRSLEPRLDFQRSQKKIQYFHWMSFLSIDVTAYWDRVIQISALSFT